MSSTTKVIQQYYMNRRYLGRSYKLPRIDTFPIKISYVGNTDLLLVLPFIFITLTWIFQPTIQYLHNLPPSSNPKSLGLLMIGLIEKKGIIKVSNKYF